MLAANGALCFPSCAESLGLAHIALNQSAGRRVLGHCHNQTVGNRKSRFKGFVFHSLGIATKYIGNYLQ